MLWRVNLPRQLGAFAAHLARIVFSVLALAADVARNVGCVFVSTSREVLLRQVYFSGIEALPIVAITALLVGYGATAQLYRLVGEDLELTLEIFRLLLVQKGSVLLVAIFFLARSGSAIASELANMKAQGEIIALYQMGIDPGRYLIAPRVFGAMLCVAALTVYFQVLLVFGCFALLSVFAGWDYFLALEKFLRGIHPMSALATVAKTFVLGGVIGVIACHQGIRAVPGPQGIPGAARNTMVQGIVAVIVLETLSSFLNVR